MRFQVSWHNSRSFPPHENSPAKPAEMPRRSHIDAGRLSISGTAGISKAFLHTLGSDNQSSRGDTGMQQLQIDSPANRAANRKSANSGTQTFPGSDLAGKSAIITGSTSGIGLGIALAFAKAGMNVMLNGLGDEEEVEATRAHIENEFNVGAAYSPADMTKPSEIAAMAEQARAQFGEVDVLVNNAGIQHVEAIETFPPEKWDAIIAIDLSSAFHGIRAVVSGMKARKWGRIINIASAHGLVASPFKSAYVAAKHGMIGLTKTVALETAEFGITVNAICPGYVLTPLVQKQIPETARARGISEEQVVKDVLLRAQPTKQFVTTGQIGALAVFLCTDEAASITGTALPVEGGWTAQ
jgi:3-hydroxybutyrate dehydrogenase